MRVRGVSRLLAQLCGLAGVDWSLGAGAAASGRSRAPSPSSRWPRGAGTGRSTRLRRLALRGTVVEHPSAAGAPANRSCRPALEPSSQSSRCAGWCRAGGSSELVFCLRLGLLPSSSAAVRSRRWACPWRRSIRRGAAPRRPRRARTSSASSATGVGLLGSRPVAARPLSPSASVRLPSRPRTRVASSARTVLDGSHSVRACRAAPRPRRPRGRQRAGPRPPRLGGRCRARRAPRRRIVRSRSSTSAATSGGDGRARARLAAPRARARARSHARPSRLISVALRAVGAQRGDAHRQADAGGALALEQEAECQQVVVERVDAPRRSRPASKREQRAARRPDASAGATWTMRARSVSSFRSPSVRR